MSCFLNSEDASSNVRGRIDEVTLIRGWCEWNLKSLNDYLEAILRLPKEERRKDRGASFGSIQDIFLHIIEDYLWWFGNVPEGRLEEYPILVGKDPSEQELRNLTRNVDRLVHSIIDPLSPSDVGRSYVVKGESGDGKPYTMTTCLADIIWHMVEEQLQHIGEINALFWQMNVDPPTHAWFSSKISHTY